MTASPDHKWSISTIRTMLLDTPRDDAMESTVEILVAPGLADRWLQAANRCRSAAEVIVALPSILKSEERLALAQYLLKPLDPELHAAVLRARDDLLVAAAGWDAHRDLQREIAKRGRRGGGGSGFGHPVDAQRAHAVLRLIHASLVAILTSEGEPPLAMTTSEMKSRVCCGESRSDTAERVAALFDFTTEAACAEFLKRVRATCRRLPPQPPVELTAREILRDIVGDLDASGFGVPKIASAADLDSRQWLRILRRKPPSPRGSSSTT